MEFVTDILIGLSPFLGFFLILLITYYIIRIFILLIKYLKLKIKHLEEKSEN